MLSKKLFSKQDLLFMKKHPRLYPICKIHDITKNEIDYIFKKTKKVALLCNISRQEFELALRMCIVKNDKEE